MKPSTTAVWLWLRFRYGPQGDLPNNAAEIAGYMLWWRLWATIATVISPYFAGVLVYAHVDPYLGLVVTYVASVVLVPKAMSLSPKYRIDENY